MNLKELNVTRFPTIEGIPSCSSPIMDLSLAHEMNLRNEFVVQATEVGCDNVHRHGRVYRLGTKE